MIDQARTRRKYTSSHSIIIIIVGIVYYYYYDYDYDYYMHLPTYIRHDSNIISMAQENARQRYRVSHTARAQALNRRRRAR